jgi:predicted permease
MQQVVNTIVPIFVIITLGLALKARNLLPEGIIGPLNRLVYYIAIPCMIFSAVVKASFRVDFDPLLLAGTLVPVCAVFGAGFAVRRPLGVRRDQMGTFLQISVHGNLGYIGLAVCFYFAGPAGFAKASILTGFLMLLQNLLAVVGLQAFSDAEDTGRRIGFLAKRVVGNPVILATLFAMTYNLLKLPLPPILERSLDIVSGMALPLALLVIGASLSFRLIRAHIRLVLWAGVLKLLALPGLGVLAYRLLGLPPDVYLPGVVLLATPTATVAYVMAGEIHGSKDLATAAISTITLLSCLTYLFWLSFWG